MPFSLQDAIACPIPPVRILDVGASMVEGPDHYAPLVARGLAEVVGFEPDVAQHATLEASGRPHYRYLPYALGDGGEAVFHIANFPGCSSILPPNKAVIDRFSAIGASPPDGNFAIVRTEPVQTRRLDDLAAETGAPDYIKLDIQGAEVTVLTNGVEALRSTLVVESEVLFVALYEGQGDFADLTALLRDQGFQLYELRDVRRCSVAPFLAEMKPFPSRGQWMWADAVYVRAWHDLSGWSDAELLKAAAILHEVYEAYDLVHHFLLEVQLRSGEPLSDRYRAAMAADPKVLAAWPMLDAAWAKALAPERIKGAMDAVRRAAIAQREQARTEQMPEPTG